MKKSQLIGLVKEVLKEDRVPLILYHFTTPRGLVGILKSNKLKSHPSFDNVSFTEDQDLWAFQEFPDSDQEIGVRLSFFYKVLPKLKPFTYQGPPGQSFEHEKEWISTTGDITFSPPISQLLSEGYITIYAQEYWKDWLKKNMDGPLSKIYNRIFWV